MPSDARAQEFGFSSVSRNSQMSSSTSSSQMRAVFVTDYGGTDKLHLANIDVPEIGVRDLLVQVKAAGVNVVDTMFREGYMGTNVFPLVMGSDFSGIVVKVGAEVTEFKAGDEVFGYKLMGNGTYAEFASVPAAYTAHKPQSLSFNEAAGLPCVGLTAYLAITEALKVKADETVVVTAATGGVGSIAVQLCRHVGAHVIATASAQNHQFIQQLGAHEVIDYTQGDWVEAVKALYPTGVDVVLTCIAGETKRLAPGAIRDGGRLCWISGEEQFGPPMERGIQGWYASGRPEAWVLSALGKIADSGHLQVPIEEVFTLEMASEAHKRVEGGHTRGKLVISVS